MAGKRTVRKVYESKATPTTISARVKLTVKIKDNYISVEGCEERTIPVEAQDVDMAKEWDMLWEEVEITCDEALADIIDDTQASRRKNSK